MLTNEQICDLVMRLAEKDKDMAKEVLLVFLELKETEGKWWLSDRQQPFYPGSVPCYGTPGVRLYNTPNTAPWDNSKTPVDPCLLKTISDIQAGRAAVKVSVDATDNNEEESCRT